MPPCCVAGAGAYCRAPSSAAAGQAGLRPQTADGDCTPPTSFSRCIMSGGSSRLVSAKLPSAASRPTPLAHTGQREAGGAGCLPSGGSTVRAALLPCLCLSILWQPQASPPTVQSTPVPPGQAQVKKNRIATLQHTPFCMRPAGHPPLSGWLAHSSRSPSQRSLSRWGAAA